ncbi:tetratricopeptide repeat protein [Chloroflexi bacterium CFX2]|nr:tetratricopeptide repeat protein [Chloroflexi bacterium CFX2]
MITEKKKKDLKKKTVNVVLQRYKNKLELCSQDLSEMLSLLVYRDVVAKEVERLSEAEVKEVDFLIELDKQLKDLLAITPIEKLVQWKTTFRPKENSWWWNFNLEEESKTGKNIFWGLVSGLLFLMTTTMALEIIKRFWVSTPDSISVIGSLIVVFITSSPLSKYSQEIFHLIFGSIKIIGPRYRAQTITGVALISFLMIFSARIWGMQSLALYYNNKGFEDLSSGNGESAQQAFERATSLNPDQVVPYQNLADFYLKVGLLDKAEIWYQKAIEQDVNFSPAYNGLGHLYNVQGEFENAELVLLTGLNVNTDLGDDNLRLVMKYQLLSNLGWAYFGQEKNDYAINILKEAILLEQEIREIEESSNSEFRNAIPHFFLAHLYVLNGEFDKAQHEWEESLRYLDASNWKEKEWIAITLENLK